MGYKEKVIEKSYFSIGEVAESLGISQSQIRFWESEFDIVKPKKNRKGTRLFTKQDIKNIKIIHHLLKERGYTLQGAKEFIKKDPKSFKNNYEMIESLKKVRFLLQHIHDNIPEQDLDLNLDIDLDKEN